MRLEAEEASDKQLKEFKQKLAQEEEQEIKRVKQMMETEAQQYK